MSKSQQCRMSVEMWMMGLMEVLASWAVIIGLSVLLGIWAVMVLLPGRAWAGPVELQPGDAVTVRCEEVIEPPTNPPPTNPPPTNPPPDGSCPAPSYPVGETKRMGNGQEIIQLHPKVATVRTVNSRYFTGTGQISLGPYGATEMITTMTVSECPGDFRPETLARSNQCAQSGSLSTMRVTTGEGGRGICRLKRETSYYINLMPLNPLTGRSSCKGLCQLTFFVSPR